MGNHGGTLENVERTIREGVPETLMQPQKGNYTPQQIVDLAKYVKLLAHRMHATSDEADRDAATELTNRLAARLPRTPTVSVGEEENFIDRYVFSKMKSRRRSPRRTLLGCRVHAPRLSGLVGATA